MTGTVMDHDGVSVTLEAAVKKGWSADHKRNVQTNLQAAFDAMDKYERDVSRWSWTAVGGFGVFYLGGVIFPHVRLVKVLCFVGLGASVYSLVSVIRQVSGRYIKGFAIREDAKDAQKAYSMLRAGIGPSKGWAALWDLIAAPWRGRAAGLHSYNNPMTWIVRELHEKVSTVEGEQNPPVAKHLKAAALQRFVYTVRGQEEEAKKHCSSALAYVKDIETFEFLLRIDMGAEVTKENFIQLLLGAIALENGTALKLIAKKREDEFPKIDAAMDALVALRRSAENTAINCAKELLSGLDENFGNSSRKSIDNFIAKQTEAHKLLIEAAEGQVEA